MTSKERVRASVEYKKTDRIPVAFETSGSVRKRLLKEYGFSTVAELYEKFKVDIIEVSPKYIGPELPDTVNGKGEIIQTSYWGFQSKIHKTDIDEFSMVNYYPLEIKTTLKEIEEYQWPNPDWFDYEDFKRRCDMHKGKALIFGHEGPFQIVTFLKTMDSFFFDMAMNPGIAHLILKKINNFELEYYERLLIAADGQLDILRPHDDYGTQISLLFSVDMWREFYAENTKRLADLAHKYGAFYQQHSCGAVAPIVPEFIKCGVDILEPLQKIPGLFPEELKANYGESIAFHGGIDTQQLLPNGTVEDVQKEVRKYIEILGQNGGYILMASQSFCADVPTKNIETIYYTDREC